MYAALAGLWGVKDRRIDVRSSHRLTRSLARWILSRIDPRSFAFCKPNLLLFIEFLKQQSMGTCLNDSIHIARPFRPTLVSSSLHTSAMMKATGTSASPLRASSNAPSAMYLRGGDHKGDDVSSPSR
jgi:hypothetical protein